MNPRHMQHRDTSRSRPPSALSLVGHLGESITEFAGSSGNDQYLKSKQRTVLDSHLAGPPWEQRVGLSGAGMTQHRDGTLPAWEVSPEQVPGSPAPAPTFVGPRQEDKWRPQTICLNFYNILKVAMKLTNC